MAKRKPLEAWKDSDQKVGFWMCHFPPKFSNLCGVLFAADKWWLFADFAPNLDRPVWHRTEEWLGQYLFDRQRALGIIGTLLLSCLSDSQRAFQLSQHLTEEALSLHYLEEAFRYERQIMDKVYKRLTASTSADYSLLPFQIRIDNPSPKES